MTLHPVAVYTGSRCKTTETPTIETNTRQAVKGERNMKINEQATLMAHKEIFIQAPPEAVWQIHSDINRWGQWHPGITVSNLAGPLAAGSVFQWKTGGLTLTSTIQVVEPNRQIGWTGQGLGTQASHLWTLQPHKDGTLLTTEESMQGWFVSLLKVLMPKFLDSSLDTWLQSLKRRAEGQSVATPVNP
jgi:uncharacterized protein YndB with AHSA1/START domain